MYVRLVSASKFKWNDLENCQGWRCARKLVYGEAVAQDLALIRQMEPVGISRRKELGLPGPLRAAEDARHGRWRSSVPRAGMIYGPRSPSRLRRQHAACNQQHQSQLPKVSVALSHSFKLYRKGVPYPSAKVEGAEVEGVVVACRRYCRRYHCRLCRQRRRRRCRHRFRLRLALRHHRQWACARCGR